MFLCGIAVETIKRLSKMWKSPFGWIFTFFTIFACINGQTVNSISEDDMQSLLNDYNLKATELCHEVQLANWDVATDVGNPTKVDAKVS